MITMENTARLGGFRGAGLGDAAGIMTLQTALSTLSQATQNGAYNPMHVDGVLDNQTLAAMFKAALDLNVPVVKAFVTPLKTLSIPVVGSLADALTNPFYLATAEIAWPAKVAEVKAWVDSHAKEIALALNAAIALVGVNSSVNPPAPTAGPKVNIASVGGFLVSKYGAGAITTKKWGKWHVAVPRKTGGMNGLGIPIYNAGTGLTGARGGLGEITHTEVAKTEQQPPGVVVVDTATYNKATKMWWQQPATLALGGAVVVALGLGTIYLVK